VRVSRVVAPAEPGKGFFAGLLSRVALVEGQRGSSLRSVLPLVIVTALGLVAAFWMQSDFLFGLLLYVSTPLSVLLLLYALLLEAVKRRPEEDKIRFTLYRCRKCRYRWGNHEMPYEPHLRRLRWEAERARERGDRVRLAAMLSDVGAFEMMTEADTSQALAHLNQAYAIRRETNDKHLAYTLDNLALAFYLLGDLNGARAFGEESVALCTAQREWKGLMASLNTLGYILLAAGDVTGARNCFDRALPMARRMADPEGIIWGIEGLAGVASAQEQGGRAARLLGAGAAVREAFARPIMPAMRERFYDPLWNSVQAGMDPATFASAWAQGRSLGVDGAVAYGLDRGGDFTLSIPQPAR
jgi:tetratricopeptide (TPR) repeat protein